MSRVLEQIRALGHSCTGNCICKNDGVNLNGDPKCTVVGHSSWLKAAAFSPDGTRIVSGADDHVVMIWHVETGALVSTRSIVLPRVICGREVDR